MKKNLKRPTFCHFKNETSQYVFSFYPKSQWNEPFADSLGKVWLEVWSLRQKIASSFVFNIIIFKVLKQLNLDGQYEGNTEINGELFSVEDNDDGPGAFRACLDVGLARTTTGAKIFGAMKGAADGGLDIPHSEKRFPGYDKEAGEFSAEVHRNHIFGQHVAQYMRELLEKDEDAYKRQFSGSIKNGITADTVRIFFKLLLIHF